MKILGVNTSDFLKTLDAMKVGGFRVDLSYVKEIEAEIAWADDSFEDRKRWRRDWERDAAGVVVTDAPGAAP